MSCTRKLKILSIAEKLRIIEILDSSKDTASQFSIPADKKVFHIQTIIDKEESLREGFYKTIFNN